MTVQEQRHGATPGTGVDTPLPGAGYIPVRVPRDAGSPPVTPPPTVPTPVTPPPATPAEPRSVLTRLVLAALLVAVGVMGMIDLAGARFPASAYFAVPLAVVAAGLIVGGWYGRGRGLIAVGAVLAVPLVIAGAAETWDLASVGGNVTWKPASVELLDDKYSLDIGNGVLDLSDLDFTGRTERVEVRVDVGNLTIILPPEVDAEVTAQVDVGNTTVFGQNTNGIGQSGQTIVDVGSDGTGGGEIVITASVDVGDLEVRR
jgi:hypothetical protein